MVVKLVLLHQRRNSGVGYPKTGSRSKCLGPRGMRTVEWTKLHNEEFCSLYHSLNIIRAIKSRRLRWAGPVAINGKKVGVLSKC